MAHLLAMLTPLLVAAALAGVPAPTAIDDGGTLEASAGAGESPAAPPAPTPDAGPPDRPDAGADADELDRRHTTVITASRTERTLEDVVVPTEVITRAQIEQQGARDLVQLLEQHPGVELVYTNRGTGIRLQGLDPEYVLILVDGQRVAGRSGSLTDLSRFSLREVERVEIIKGPAAALYGADAIGGVINLITHEPKKPLEGTLRAAGGGMSHAAGSSPVGTEADVRGNVGAKLGDFSLRLGGGYRQRDAYDWDRADVATSGPKLLREDADVDLTWRPSARTSAWLRGAYVFTDLTGIDINDTGAIFDRYQRTEQADAWAGGKTTFDTGTTVTLRGHYGYFRDQFLLDQRSSRALDDYSQNRTRLWEGLVQGDQKLPGGHLLSAGGELYLEGLVSNRIDPGSVSRNRTGVFVQDTWGTALGETRLTLEPGVRFDQDSQFGAAPSPRVALKVDPLPALTLRGAWGLGFRPPTFSELYLQFANPAIGYVVEGNPKLQPERSSSFELSADFRPPLEGSLVSVSAWRTDTRNLINITVDKPPDPDSPSVFNYENVAEAYTQGVELSGRVRLVKATWLELGGMLLDARDVTRNRPLEGRAPVKLTAQLTSKLRPWHLEGFFRASWSAPRPFYLGNGLGFANVLGFGEDKTVYAPATFDLELQVAWAVRERIKVFVNGRNLLDSGDQNFNPRPPRAVLGGVQLDL